MANNDNLSEDEINRDEKGDKKARRNSADTSENALEIPTRIRTRANSQDTRPRNIFEATKPAEAEVKSEKEAQGEKKVEGEM